MKKLIPLAIIAISFFASCSNDANEIETISISDQTLSGFVLGDEFLATGGRSLINEGESVSINLTNTIADCSTNILDFVYSVSADVPNRIGFHRNVVVSFVRGNEPAVNVANSTVEIIEIIEITETQVTGRIRSESDTPENTVEGAFVLDICTE